MDLEMQQMPGALGDDTTEDTDEAKDVGPPLKIVRRVIVRTPPKMSQTIQRTGPRPEQTIKLVLLPKASNGEARWPIVCVGDSGNE